MKLRSGHNQNGVAVAEGVPATGEIVAGKYRVEGVLGIGGMGVVLAARHLTLAQPVAIKLLTIEDEQARGEAAARLIREARAAASLGSEHVVRVYDVGTDAGRPFIVMERLEGADLAQVLRARGPLPIDEVAALAVQACRAVAEAHRAGIVHRDLKPSNLFLTRRADGTAELKVLDFGIAKSLRPESKNEETLTGARTALGSPSYMSPEQVRNARQVDTRTDVWSLGVILYELLTGRLVFEASTFMAVSAAIVADTPLPPSSLRADIPAELERVVLRCLEKDPDARFGEVEELLAALLPFASAAPVFRDSLPPSSMPETSLTVEQEPMLDVGDADREGVGATQPPGSSLTSFELDASKTLQSGSGARLGSRLLVTATQRSGAAPPLSRRKLALGVVGLATLVGGAAALWSREPRVEPASSSLISIDSKPAGARVREGSVHLGLTPISISKGEGTSGVRRFSLELDGYVSHTVTSAANAKGPQHISVTLVPLAAQPLSAPRAESRRDGALPRAPASTAEQAPRASASTAEQAPRVPASTAEQAPRAPRVPRPAPSGEGIEPEIRMSR